MIKTAAKWLAFAIALLAFLSSLISLSDSLKVMAYLAFFGGFGFIGAAASTILFAAVMFGVLKKKAWTVKCAMAAAAVNTLYLIILGFLPIPPEMLAEMGVTDMESASKLMWMFVSTSSILNIAMAGLVYFSKDELKG
jgi:hypothetical protein